MSLLLYINGQLADLDPGQVIAQTKQVNDLNSLENRQASYTNKFSLPKTAHNTGIMQFLTLSGNNSAVPYQKNECSLYSYTGECFVYKGWAVITDGEDSYDVVVYDGIIDLYKAIENKTLADLVLLEINHTKDVATVKGSMYSDYFGTPPFTYILTDYNGKTGDTTATRHINIDYLTPSVNVKWLWNKVFTSFNATYEGTVFNDDNFKNLWMTFPKGATSADADLEVLNIDTYQFANPSILFASYTAYYFKTLQFDTLNAQYVQALPLTHIRVLQTSMYRLEVEGTLNTTNSPLLCVGKNCEQYNDASSAPVVHTFGLATDGQPFTYSNVFSLNAGDSLCLILKRRDNNHSFKFDGDCSATVRLVKIDASVDFSAAFADFSIRDFLQEVVHRFGLTLYKGKYSNSYTFLTLRELLQTSPVEDWSGKLAKKVSENYISGSYAQRNWFRYAYNDKESTYNDGSVDVGNVNLADGRDVIKSKIYSPERVTVSYLNMQVPVFKLWEKEPVDDPAAPEPFTYKALDKRYYFLRRELISGEPTITLESPLLGQSETAPIFNIARYNGLPFNDVVQDYYTPLQQVIQEACMVTADLWLTDSDVVNFDFKKLYYLEQLSAYFLMNKISNYIPGKPVRCELVKVQYTHPAHRPSVQIQGVVQDLQSYNYNVFFSVNNFTMEEGSVLQFKASQDNVAWVNIGTASVTQSPKLFGGGTGYNNLLYWKVEYAPLSLVSDVYHIG